MTMTVMSITTMHDHAHHEHDHAMMITRTSMNMPMATTHARERDVGGGMAIRICRLRGDRGVCRTEPAARKLAKSTPTKNATTA